MLQAILNIYLPGMSSNLAEPESGIDTANPALLADFLDFKTPSDNTPVSYE